MSGSSQKTIVICGGGTGGHIFPAVSLARDLMARGYRVVFLTDARGFRYKEKTLDVVMQALPSSPVKPGLVGKVKSLSVLGWGAIKAYLKIKELKPSVVVGVGGYPSYLPVKAAQMMGIPTIIHEQNAIIGKANAALARKADRIAISMPKITGLDESDAVRTVFTGNPVRQEIADLYTKPYPNLAEDGTLNIFVTGGSLGASVFSDVIPKAIPKLSGIYKKRISIIQQCRAEDIEDVRVHYEAMDIDYQLSDFFDNVAEILGQAHLVICRSGAGNVAEVTAAGRPAIFVPYPHHKDQQQKVNAEAVADKGGAWVMTEDGFTPQALATRLEMFLQNPDILFRAAESSRSCGQPDATKRLGNLVMALETGWDKEASKSYDLTQGWSS